MIGTIVVRRHAGRRARRASEQTGAFVLDERAAPLRRRRAGLHRAAQRRDRRRTVYGFVVAALIGAVTYFWPALSVALAGTGHQIRGTAAATGAAATGQPFTVLLLGSDNDSKFSADHHLTQSMILVRVDPRAGHVTMLSIPRDLYVPLSTGGTDKIDKAFLYGGADAAVNTVASDLHVHIDHYVWIGLQGLVNLIDLVGGVDVDVTHPVLDDFYPADQTSQNPYDFDRVALLAGPQHLDGLHAMEYVRSRHDDALSDIGRSQRQQQVLVALRERLSGLGITDVPRLAQALQGQFSTDVSLTDIGFIGWVLGFARHLDPASIGHAVLLQPYWQSRWIGGQDVLVPNWNAILPLVHQTFPAT